MRYAADPGFFDRESFFRYTGRVIIDGRIMETTEEEVKSVEAMGTEGSTSQMSRMKRSTLTARINKKSLVVFVVFVAVCGILYSLRGFLVAVTVDGRPISRWSIIRELEEKSGEQALDAVVTKQLIASAAKKAKIVVSPSDVDKEVASVTEQVTKQGGTLALALEQQGMTEADFRDQIILQKELEQLLGNSVQVTDDDVNQYLAQTKATAPKGTSDADFRSQIREQLKGQKFNMAASKWVKDAKAKAQITYFVDYAPAPAPVITSPTDTEAPISNNAPTGDGQKQ